LIEEQYDLLRDFHGHEPLPQDVRLCIAQALCRDGAFRAFVEDQAPEDCCDEQKWAKIVLAGAGTIMVQYDDACGSGRWP